MIPTKNFSSRLGERVRLLALHDTEGARTVESLGAFFQRVTNASYHGAVDDNRYESYVDYSYAAWHLRNGNQEADGLALCGFAAWSRAEWLRHPKMLDLAAAWLAERSRARNIPLQHLNYSQIVDCMNQRNHPGGVLMHRDYTYATRDGTHTDLGVNFPLDDVVLPKARHILAILTNRPTAKRIEMVYNQRVFGVGVTPLICTVGSSSLVVSRAWINAIVDGPNPGRVHFWAQSDTGGIADKSLSVQFSEGRSSRAGWELPDGTTQVRVFHEFDGWGTIALEVLPK